jgi:flagellar biosynthesis protein FlhB
MSEERTEQPTAKRLEKFREEGRVAKSQELGGIVVLCAGIYLLSIIGPRLVTSMADLMRSSYLQVGKQRTTELSFNYLQGIIGHSLIETSLALAPWLAVLVVVGIGANVVQTRGLVQPRLLIPKWDRLNPLKRAKQMFGMQLLVETVKGLLKQAAIVLVVYFTIANYLDDLITAAQMGLSAGINGLTYVAYNMSLQAAAVLLGIALLDYGWQYRQHRKSLLMTKQEVRDETKQQEGSPEVKGRIRRIQREMAQRRMMQQIPNADALIVNPTHFAVAIRYDSATMVAPKMIAKGQDEVALKMISIARRHNVPVVPNKPLARALYKFPVDTTIPPEFFQAVAEVLAFVYSLSGQRGRVRDQENSRIT